MSDAGPRPNTNRSQEVEHRRRSYSMGCNIVSGHYSTWPFQAPSAATLPSLTRLLPTQTLVPQRTLSEEPEIKCSWC